MPSSRGSSSLTQGLNPCLLYGRQILYHLSHWEYNQAQIKPHPGKLIDLGFDERIKPFQPNLELAT